MGLFKKKEKLVSFFIVSDIDNKNKIYTFTNSYDQAYEYMCKLYLYLYRYDHYYNWCELRNLKPGDEAIVKYIIENELDVLSKFSIDLISYTENNLSALFRIYNGCVPLNCSYETTEEQRIYSEKLKYETEKD